MWKNIFPFLGWFENYNRSSLRADALSGLTVALILIPQSMAYAQLAGLPSYYGLYASFLPPLVAALFGSSRQLATGPVAVVSVMTSVTLGRLAATGSDGYIAYAVILALLVGQFQFLLGALRLGLVVNFISHPVINGFTNAAAIIIATSQLSKLFGVTVDAGNHHYETVFRTVEAAFTHTHWPTFLLGIFAFGVMYIIKKFWPRVPHILVAVTLATLISWATGFDREYPCPATAISSPEVHGRIREYHATVVEMDRLTERSAELGLKIMEFEVLYGGPSVETIELTRELGLVTIELESLRKKHLILIKLLNSISFSAVEEDPGRLRFYPRGALPPGSQSDGRIWRIRIGRRVLDEKALVMSGGGEVVGSVPAGLPSFSLPGLDAVTLLRLFPYAIILSLLGFMEAISIAKAMASKTGQRLDPNQELIGQGLANIVGSLGSGYPVSGSFSRSAVNYQSGAVTGLSSAFTSLGVTLVLLFFTPLLYHIPQSVLAAIIMMAVLGLLNVHGFIHAWRAQRLDGVISIISFVCTLFFAPYLDTGILVGIGLSLLVFLYRSMRPRVAILSRLPNGSYHDAGTFGMKMCEHIAMVRFDGPLFFANASYLEDRIAKLRMNMPRLTHIHIESSGIDDMDATGEEVLSLIVERLRSAGLGTSFSGLKKGVLDVMKRTKLYEKIGEANIYPTQDAAVKSVYSAAHRDSEEKNCPLISYVQLPERKNHRFSVF